jgi:hypothetical protein
MMLEEQLSRYWFFKKVGAFSINPNNSKSILETFDYTNEILNDTNNAVVMYPQGEIEPFEKKPLKIKKGIKFLLNNLKKDSIIIPVAFKIQHYDNKNPVVIFRWGKKITSGLILRDFSFFERNFYENLDNLTKLSYERDFLGDLFKY